MSLRLDFHKVPLDSRRQVPLRLDFSKVLLDSRCQVPPDWISARLCWIPSVRCRSGWISARSRWIASVRCRAIWILARSRWIPGVRCCTAHVSGATQSVPGKGSIGLQFTDVEHKGPQERGRESMQVRQLGSDLQVDPPSMGSPQPSARLSQPPIICGNSVTGPSERVSGKGQAEELQLVPFAFLGPPLPKFSTSNSESRTITVVCDVVERQGVVDSKGRVCLKGPEYFSVASEDTRVGEEVSLALCHKQ